MHDSVFKLMDEIRAKFIKQDVHRARIDNKVIVALYRQLDKLDLSDELTKQYHKLYKLELELARRKTIDKLKKLIKDKTSYDASGSYTVTEVSDILDIPRDIVLLIQRRVLGSIAKVEGKRPQGRLSTPEVSRKLKDYLYRGEEEIF